MKYERGYLDPTPPIFEEKKLGNLSARVPLPVVEDIDAIAREHRLARAEVVRICIENTLYRDDKSNHVLFMNSQSMNSMKARNYKDESTSIRGFLIQILNSFLQAQKNPEVRVQDLVAQHHKGY